MSSNSNKKPENKQPVQLVSIDEIVNTVANFEFSIDSKSADENQEQSKTKKPISLAQIHKENLAKLLATINKLKGSVVIEESSRELKIKELYELLKSKLGNDLYLFNVNIVVKYLHGYKGTNDDKLDKSINLLMDNISTYVDCELKKLLPDNDYNLLTNLFKNETEPNILQIIKSAVGEKTIDEDNTGKKKILSFLYIYVVLKNRSRYDFYKQLFIVERVFAEYLAEFETGEPSKYLLKLLPEALLDSNPKAKIRSFVYLYFTTHNELKKNVDFLTDKLSDSRSVIYKLSSEKNQLIEQGKEKDNEINQLNEAGIKKDSEIVNLNAQLVDTIKKSSYEINDLRRQLDVTRSGLVSNIQKQTKIVLDDLTVIASRIPIDQGDELRDWIKHLKGYFDSLVEKK
jgi:hypothetical protein